MTSHVFEVVVRGRMSDELVAALDGFVVVTGDDGLTRVVGDVLDQPRLLGLLAAFDDLHMEVVSVNRVPADSASGESKLSSRSRPEAAGDTTHHQDAARAAQEKEKMMPLRRIGRPGLIGMAARTAVVAGTATAVSGSVQRHQQEKAQNQYNEQQAAAAEQQAQIDAAAQAAAAQYAQPAPAAAPASSGGTDVVAELQKLASLKEAGVLNDEEFAAAKAKLLA